MEVVQNGKKINVQGNSFKMTLPIIFEQGDVFAARFSGGVNEGVLESVANLQIEPAGMVQAEIAPKNASIKQLLYRADVPWEKRGINAVQLEVNLPGGSRVAYKPRSYVEFEPSLDGEKQAALASKSPNYVTNIDSGLAGIKMEMANKSQVEKDLEFLGVGIKFPDSPIEITPYRGENQTEEQVLALLKGTWNETYPDMGEINFTKTWRLVLELPGRIGDGYMVANRTMQLNSLYPPGENGTLKVVFQPVGRRIDSFIEAEYSPAGAGGEANISKEAG